MSSNIRRVLSSLIGGSNMKYLGYIDGDDEVTRYIRFSSVDNYLIVFTAGCYGQVTTLKMNAISKSKTSATSISCEVKVTVTPVSSSYWEINFKKASTDRSGYCFFFDGEYESSVISSI